jgi:hypothetical protein
MMHAYRTTFTASPSVAKAIQDIARAEGKSISSVVNELLQSALEGNISTKKSREPFKVVPFALNMSPNIDPTRLKDVLYDLDVEDR